MRALILRPISQYRRISSRLTDVAARSWAVRTRILRSSRNSRYSGVAISDKLVMVGS